MKRFILSLILVVVAGTAYSLTVTNNDFISGQTIVSAEIDQNFDEIDTAVTALEDDLPLIVSPASFTGAAIQTAIDAAVTANPPAGAILEIPAGTYTDVEIEIKPPVFEVYCIGNLGDCILEHATDVMNSETTILVEARDNHTRGLRISGLELDGNKDQWTSGGTTFVGGPPASADAHRGIEVNDATANTMTGLIIENNHIHHYNSEGIFVQGAEGGRISNNILEFLGCQDDGASTWTPNGQAAADIECGTWGAAAADEDNQTGRKTVGVGIEISKYSSDVVVENNIVRYFTKIGIQTQGGATEVLYPERITVRNNEVGWGNDAGIAMVRSRTPSVTDNFIHDIDTSWGVGNVNQGLTCSRGGRHGQFVGNTIERTGGTGMNAACGCGMHTSTEGTCDTVFAFNTISQACNTQAAYYNIAQENSGYPSQTGRMALIGNVVSDSGCTSQDIYYPDPLYSDRLIVTPANVADDIAWTGAHDFTPPVNDDATAAPAHHAVIDMKLWKESGGSKAEGAKTGNAGLEIEYVNQSPGESFGVRKMGYHAADSDAVGVFTSDYCIGGAQDVGDEGCKNVKGFVFDHFQVARGSLDTAITTGGGTIAASVSDLTEAESRMIGSGNLVLFHTGDYAARTPVTVEIVDVPPGTLTATATYEDASTWTTAGNGTGQGVWTLGTGDVTGDDQYNGMCFSGVDGDYSDQAGTPVTTRQWLYITDTVASNDTIITEWIAQGVDAKTPYGYRASEGAGEGEIIDCAKIVSVDDGGDYVIDTITVTQNATSTAADTDDFSVHSYGAHTLGGVWIGAGRQNGYRYGDDIFKASNSLGAGRYQLGSAYTVGYEGSLGSLIDDVTAFGKGLECLAGACEIGFDYNFLDTSNIGWALEVTGGSTRWSGDNLHTVVYVANNTAYNLGLKPTEGWRIGSDKVAHEGADLTWTGAHDFGGATALEVPNTVVGSLPTATLGRLAIVTDGSDADDCTTGGGSTQVECMANGSTWEPTGDSGAGGGDDVQVQALTFGDASTSVVHTYDTNSTDPTLTFANTGAATYSSTWVANALQATAGVTAGTSFAAGSGAQDGSVSLWDDGAGGDSITTIAPFENGGTTWTLTLPTDGGTVDYVLRTDGSGNTSWVAQSGGDVVNDTTPQLGGDLDLNSNDITGTGNVNITGTGTFSGAVSAASYGTSGNAAAEMRLTGSVGTDDIAIDYTDNGTTTTMDQTVDDGTGDDVIYIQLDGANATVEIHDVFDFQKDGVLVHTATIDDDVCDTAGEWWYDTTDTAFEFCEAASGAPTTLGGGGGETNTLASPDVASEVDLINSVSKTGTALNLVSLEADDFTVTSNIITIDTGATAGIQAHDAELDTIAALTETNGGVIFAAGGAWTTDTTPALDISDATGSLALGTGTLSGAVDVDTTDGTSPDTIVAVGNWVFTDDSVAYELDLPAAASGASVCVYSPTAHVITIDPNASEVIVLDGTALTGGVDIDSAGGAGDFICLLSNGTNWYTLGRNGTWVEGT